MTTTDEECAQCGHPVRQHDDGGCMYPRWDKSGGTTCYCAECPEDFRVARLEGHLGMVHKMDAAVVAAFEGDWDALVQEHGQQHECGHEHLHPFLPGVFVDYFRDPDEEESSGKPPDWAQEPGEEWRRVPSTLLIAWHPEDRIWIAEDLTRRGCWHSAPTPDEALAGLQLAAEHYDDVFGSDPSRLPVGPTYGATPLANSDSGTSS